MYNDTIKVSNKIISDTDILDIFQKMYDDAKENTRIYKQEAAENERYEWEYQRWTLKNFSYEFRCTFDFYDDTSISVDNYDSIVATFNSRLHEIHKMWFRFSYNYSITEAPKQEKYVSKHIFMDIYENRMDLDISLGHDSKMEDVFKFIKQKISDAPEKYDRIIKKKTAITSKITFAIGMIPGMIICSLLLIAPTIRQVYKMTFVGYPLGVLIISYVLGGLLVGGVISKMYSSISPEKRYAGYDSRNHRSVYKDDIEQYVSTSEIIIGKNIDNMKKREEIAELEKKYSKFIPIELIILLVLSVVVVIIG